MLTPPCGSQSTVMGVDTVTHREGAVLTIARVGRCKGESWEHRFSSGWFLRGGFFLRGSGVGGGECQLSLGQQQ